MQGPFEQAFLRSALRGALVVVLFLAACPPLPAQADGGTVRVSERQGAYQLTVFTAPAIVRAGPVDFSVLVQDPDNGEVLSDGTAVVIVSAQDGIGGTTQCGATSAAATNKLFRAATVIIPEPGKWSVRVSISGIRGPASLNFELEVLKPLPRWSSVWLWIAWPAVVVALFCIHQLLADRTSRTLLAR